MAALALAALGGVLSIACLVFAALPCIEALYEYRDEAWTAWIRTVTAGLQGFAAIVEGRAYWAWSRGSCAHIFP